MAELLPHLETFALAAETGNFSATARHLGLTQAAVSQRVAALERDLGVALFTRQGGGLQLTAAGRRLHGYARQILALCAEARAEVTGRPVELHGELVVAASSIPGEHLLPEFLPRFQARHPHIHLRASVTDSRDVFRLVEAGEAHLGLAGDASECPHLEHRVFAQDEMVLVVPASHPWASQDAISLDDLATQPLIVREPGSGSRHCLEAGLCRAGRRLSELPVALQLGSNEAIREAVLHGLGGAFLSHFAVRDTVRAGRLAIIPVTGLDLKRDLYAVFDRRRALTIPARLFLELLTRPQE